ncbi:MAG: hypothetical protein GY874_04055 [Desulfobacteraceae bacterium]|nr:hypothetical protein [Desulfobacteraceae bacterium]
MKRWANLFSLILIIFLAGSKLAWSMENYQVAIIRHQQYDNYEQAREGFIESLATMGFKERIKIVVDYNAYNNINELKKKVKSLTQNKELDLIFSIGTHSSKIMVEHVKKIPFVFTGVADPKNAGIVKDWKSSGGNYTGVGTPSYYTKVVGLMRNFIPFKSLGMVYLKGSPSHEAGIIQIENLSRELGFKFIKKGFTFRDKNSMPYPKQIIRQNLKNCLQEICPKVEAFFVQTSNTFTREFSIFRDAFLQYRIISAGDQTNIKKGIVMGIGKDNHRFGRQCAQYAIKILEGTPPAQLRMDVGTKLTIDVNLKAAELIDFKPPFELISSADNLYRELRNRN